MLDLSDPTQIINLSTYLLPFGQLHGLNEFIFTTWASSGFNELLFTIWALMIFLGLWEHGHPVIWDIDPALCHGFRPTFQQSLFTLIENERSPVTDHRQRRTVGPVRTPELRTSPVLPVLPLLTLVYIETRVEEITYSFVSFLYITESSLRDFSSLLLSLVIFWFIF